MYHQQLGATDTTVSILDLQQQINRFAKAAGFATVVPDGAFGTKTQQGVYNSLRWISANPSIDQAFRNSAVNYIANWDGKSGPQLALIALFIGNVANQINLAAPAKAPPKVSTLPPTLLPPGTPPAAEGGVAASVAAGFANLSTVGKLAAVATLGVIGYLIVGRKKGA